MDTFTYLSVAIIEREVNVTSKIIVSCIKNNYNLKLTMKNISK